MVTLDDLDTMKIDLENPLTCLCTNGNNSQIAVAGRNVLQLFNVTKDSFVLLHKMKPGGRSGPTGQYASGSQLNYSFSDVAWCQADENILATASTNGSILLWDLSRQLMNTRTIMAHLRTTHRIVFKPGEPWSLLSASQDGTVKLFDLREEQPAHIQFACKGMNSSTRDVQYCPNYNSFVAAHENGQLIFWDSRNTSRPLRTIMGHACPIHSIDWHPRWSSDNFNWLATAGSRDHMIKVWDLNQSDVNSCIYSVRTSNVTRIRWRPDKHKQLASCCNLMFDLNIHIWELNRPYIPYATFEGHRDVVTGLTWKSDKDILFSVGKDGLLIRHSFKDASHLVNSINPLALSLSPRGDILAAMSSDKIACNKAMRPNNPMKSSQTLQKRMQPHKLNFLSMSSNLFSISVKNTETMLQRGVPLTPDIFVTMATSYRLCGSSLTELCNHNAQVAEHCNQPYVARFWLLLPFIFYNCNTTAQNALLTKDAQSIDRSETERGSDSRQNDSEPNTSRDKTNKQDTYSGANTDDSPDVLTEDDFSRLGNIAGLTKEPGDFLFYEGDDPNILPNNYSTQKKSTAPQDQYYISSNGFYDECTEMPPEAFQPRHEIAEGMSFLNTSGTNDMSCQSAPFPGERMPPALSHHRSKVLKSARTDSTNSNSSKAGKVNRTDSLTKQEADKTCELLFPSKQVLVSPPLCDLKSHVAEQLLQLVENGHLQTACTAILILGDHVNLAEVVEDSQQENWFRAYIDLLSRFRLWSIITQIINLSNHPNISILNQKSTKVITRCGRCSKALDKYGSYCHKHKDPTPIVCAICHQVVRGLFLWCQGCSHGGHFQHILDWYKRRDECPSGCGHKCEFT